MRVISGTARGRIIYRPRSCFARSTSSRVRESLFAILSNDVAGAKVLDLYAGIGTLGLEALSRGVSHVTFIEHNKRCVEAIKRNLSNLNFNNKAVVLLRDVQKVLVYLPRQRGKYDCVFVDPPYNSKLAGVTLSQPGWGKLLKEKAVVVVEHNDKTCLADVFCDLVLFRREKYGQTALSFYRLR